jgi:hypothetical protein
LASSRRRAWRLKGANPILAPFASLGASMGLQTTSGARPGSRTLSGNTSYHSSGFAIDESGPAAAMKRYAATLYMRFGRRLRELISPWPELGIKDGAPYRYSAAIQAQHSGGNAHVHVAFTGDGEGRKGDGTGIYSGTDLERLWVRAGGRPGQARLMAAIALAESGGDPNAGHSHPYHGLWQVGPGGSFDPLTNAREAVGKLRTQGLGAWETYTNGAYRGFLGRVPSMRGGGGAAAPSGSDWGGGPSFSGATPAEIAAHAERTGMNRIAPILRAFNKDRRPLLQGILRAGRSADRASGALGILQRVHGLTDEDLATPEGRTARAAELGSEYAVSMRGTRATVRQLDRAKKLVQHYNREIARLRARMHGTHGGQRRAIQAEIAKVGGLRDEARQQVTDLGGTWAESFLGGEELLKEQRATLVPPDSGSADTPAAATSRAATPARRTRRRLTARRRSSTRSTASATN